MTGPGAARANVEIKARCRDLDAARERAREIATEWIGLDRQVDTYFRTQRGRLKLRESSLSGGQLVPYLRPDREGPKRSDYRVVPVEDPAGVKELLSRILGVHRVVAKDREIALYRNVRIHLDRVDGLGTFLELEAVFDGGAAAERAEHEQVRFLMDRLGIEEADLLSASYETLLGEDSGDGA